MSSPLDGCKAMNPFDLFESANIYKMAVLYFTRSRGLAIVGRKTPGGLVEVIQLSGEVDPHSGRFTAIDYQSIPGKEAPTVISKGAFDRLIAYVESRIDDHTRMSVIEPDVMRTLPTEPAQEDPHYVH